MSSAAPLPLDPRIGGVLIWDGVGRSLTPAETASTIARRVRDLRVELDEGYFVGTLDAATVEHFAQLVEAGYGARAHDHGVVSRSVHNGIRTFLHETADRGRYSRLFEKAQELLGVLRAWRGWL